MATEVFAAAAPVLDAWAAALRHGERPAWLTPARAALAGFMGATADDAITVFLLPAPPAGSFRAPEAPAAAGSSASPDSPGLSAAPAANGETWATFIGVGYRALWCGGAPFVHERLYEDLLHAAAHAAQPAVLDPLIAAFLDTPQGRRAAERVEGTPYAPRRRHIPELDDPGLNGYLREMIVHTLVYQGALREASGRPALDAHWRRIAADARRVLADPVLSRERAHFYDSWVLGGCAQLVPLARRSLAEGRPVDEVFVRAAVEAFESLYETWRSAAAPGPAAGLPLYLLWNGCSVLVIINGISLRQLVTPDRLQSRVNAAGRMIAWGGTPFGAATGGLLADAVGVRAAYVLMAAVAVVTVLAAWRSPLRGHARAQDLVAATVGA